MPLVGYIPSMEGVKCKAATAPITGSGADVIPFDSTDPLVLVDVAAGTPAYQGGTVTNESCYNVELTVSYLNGGDCEPCTTDTLELVDTTYTIPPGGIWQIADAYWQDAEVVRVDGTGTPIVADNGNDTGISWETEYTPECPSCVVLAV